MKKIIFLLIILAFLFTGRADAQFTVPTPEVASSWVDRNPPPVDSTSPRVWCQWHRDFARAFDFNFKVTNDTDDDCVILVAVNGTWHHYYSGNQFCSDNTGYADILPPSHKCITILSTKTTQQNKQKLPPIDTSKTTKLPLGLSSSDGLIILMGVFLFIIVIIIKRKQIWPNKFARIPADKEENKKRVNDKYKWLVDNSFIAGALSTMISFCVSFVSQSSQLMPLLKNYWQIFLIIAILGLIFGLLGIKSPRKAFVYIGIVFNIIAIILWLKIGMII